ncbi:MAG TPA: helix-turn-helix transcriptional regulator [Lysobacter sp.]
MNAIRPVGELIRDWRQRRRLTQLDLAAMADTSTRHVSFIETGRSLPSRAMLMRLAERLEVPLRERNVLMTAAGLAPVYGQRAFDDPALQQARAAIDMVLTGHEPYPAVAVDRHWNLVAANRALAPMLAGAAPHLLEPPVNILRLSLHPEGVAPRIVNFGEIRAHLLQRLRHQADSTGDPELRELYDELSAYPMPPGSVPHADPDWQPAKSVAMQLQLRTEAGVLSFITTVTVFGTPTDVTLSELAIESFFPADAATADALRGMPLG